MKFYHIFILILLPKKGQNLYCLKISNDNLCNYRQVFSDKMNVITSVNKKHVTGK